MISEHTTLPRGVVPVLTVEEIKLLVKKKIFVLNMKSAFLISQNFTIIKFSWLILYKHKIIQPVATSIGEPNGLENLQRF